MNKWKSIASRIVFSNKWIKLEEVEFILPNGKMRCKYYFVRGNPVAAVLGITKDKKVILVKQYRPSIGKFTIDLPGGGIEKGETASEAAKREFLEETGYQLKNFQELTSFYYDSGKSDQSSTIFAGDAEYVGTSKNNKTERIQILKMPIKQLMEKIHSGEIMETTVRLAVFSLVNSDLKKRYL